MTFTEQLEQDIKTVFLNPEEFAETLHIKYGDDFEGDIPVVLDEAVQKDLPESDREDNRTYGVYGITAMLYAAKSDMGLVPKKERQIWVGDELFYIVTSACDAGQIALGLRRVDE